MTLSRFGWAMLALLLAFALLAPLVDPVGPFKQSLLKALSGADAAAPFGYDHLGRSIFARLAHALRLSLMLAFAATATAALIGIALGALASWRGGWIDRALCLLADSVLALPALLMILMMGVILPATALAFWAGLAAVQWIEFFRLTRAAARSHLASPAVEAATLQGFGPLWIFRRILWPEIGPMLRTAMAFGVANAIAAIAALGFVSVGMRAPTPELGLMMVELLPSWREAPFALLQPVLACFLLLLSLNLIAGARK
ncbi:ABC transporter permease subunit (plasmid) [Gemmobacter fulvus]|uniref:ABC transporter permease subunit n=1 Tax=Gemmobacter fulvus TaxID=2840474 RepID=A0A975PBA6_9RHOB|nr:ABC transporter permease subunit [Gemmobacter fulvus]MBT9246467.1 ABC transporter permease subunit [Gemmobacter fulvus]QWK92568.1 ABC transporter permease subunit [Gemmobacter fulvus]